MDIIDFSRHCFGPVYIRGQSLVTPRLSIYLHLTGTTMLENPFVNWTGLFRGYFVFSRCTNDAQILQFRVKTADRKEQAIKESKETCRQTKVDISDSKLESALVFPGWM